MLLVSFLREDRVAPSLKCRETLIQDARNAAVGGGPDTALASRPRVEQWPIER